MVGSVHVLVRPVTIRGGQSARDNNFMLRCLLCLYIVFVAVQ